TTPTLAAVAATVLALGAPVAGAQDFYEGRTLEMIINYGPGGPTDIEGRIVARHLAEHIPGNPDIVVRNMAGAAGATGINFLGEVADNDGYTMGFFTWNPVDQILDSPALRVRLENFELIAGFEQPLVVYVRRDAGTGLETQADIVNVGEVTAGASGTQSPAVLRMTLALDILGVPHRLVTGYQGARGVQTAVMQGEVDLTTNSLPGYRGATEPVLVEPGIAMPLFYFDFLQDDGSVGPLETLTDMPSFLEVYRAVHGADAIPEGQKWDLLLLLNGLMDRMYRTVFLPPDAPDEAVEILREAFVALSQDPDFVEEYVSVVKNQPSMVVAADGEAIIDELANIDEETRAFLAAFVDEIAQR
ncbi:MAG: Bug family tripartite tricarboxylate transporter substrate binding protein, partial [Pseudomonadota bacterium]